MLSLLGDAPLRAGFLKGDRAAENEALLQEFLASPRCHVPAIDEETAHRYGAIHDLTKLEPLAGA